MSKLPIGRAVQRGDRFTVDEVSRAWSDRRAAILAAYETTHNYERVGQVFGISAQRVQQIVKRYGRAA